MQIMPSKIRRKCCHAYLRPGDMVKNQFKEDMVKIISKKVWYKIGQDVSSMQQHMI
jgi:hypothetical protein